MRLGRVAGKVVLSVAMTELVGTTLLVVEPLTHDDLLGDRQTASGKALIVADQMGPSHGQTIAFVEGPEASNPYWPDLVPIDAYCSLIVDNLEYKPKAVNGN